MLVHKSRSRMLRIFHLMSLFFNCDYVGSYIKIKYIGNIFNIETLFVSSCYVSDEHFKNRYITGCWTVINTAMYPWQRIFAPLL